jgi:HSP20 family protein
MVDIRSLVPFSRSRSVSRRPEDADPFLAFRREMNRVFDDFLSGAGLPSLVGNAPRAMGLAELTPQLDVSETDQEVRIAAELPGISEDDVEVEVADDVLTIRGEKSAEREEKERDYHLTERAEGSFARSLVLPFPVDPEQVQARFKDGVLTITIPKPEEMRQKARKIEVKREEGAQAGKRARVDRAAAGDKPGAAGRTGSERAAE